MDHHPHSTLNSQKTPQMKLSHTLLLSLFSASFALAAPPENHRADRYKDLYLNSPITDPPIVEEPDVGPSAIPDWVLVGVTKYVSGTKVQIMNMKDRSRIVIPSKEATEGGFSIIEVVQDRNYLKNTVVTLQIGKDKGEVRFDPKFLVLKQVAGPTAASSKTPSSSKTESSSRTSNQPPTPPGVKTPTSTTNRSGSTPPQPGAVPQPSTSAATSSSTKTSTSGSSSSSKRTRYVPRPKK
jgi:hypothetical protein